MNDIKRSAWWTILVLADASALVQLQPDWAPLLRDVMAPHRWLERVGADRAVLTLALAALWFVALWLAVGLSFLAAASLPGRAGASARRAAARLLPAVMLRAVAGVAGLGVIVAPIAPIAAGAQATPPASAVPAPGWPTDPNPVPGAPVDWPTDPAPPSAHARRPTATRASPGSRPTPARDTTPAPPQRAPGPSPTSRPPIPHPRTPTTPPHHPTTPTLPTTPAPTGGEADQENRAPSLGDHMVRVQPGDSLWLIAAHRLGPAASDTQIAAEWPRWYAANRPVIGTDPSLIQPGDVLHAPARPDAAGGSDTPRRPT
jgi:nucleoid-associated protein YgaU